MPLHPGDVSLTYQRETWGKGPDGNSVRSVEIGFTVRGKVQTSVLVPAASYSADLVSKVVGDKAEEIIKVLDMYP